MGGDRAPDEIVAGALDAASEGIEIVLFGAPGIETHGLELIEAPDVIEMHEKPAEAVRAKPDSSLVAAHIAVAEGRADAVLSAGNTGAMLAAGLLHLRRIPGVMRPAIAVPIPTRSGRPFVLLDSGANADGRPEHLLQFAHMGVIFAEDILEIQRPEVRLLSIGEEPEKGNQLTLEAYGLLETGAVGFAGNAESRDLLEGAGDVIVCDGFTGNIVLKLLEGTIKTILDALRAEVLATPRGKVAAFLIRPAARRLRTQVRPGHVRRRVPARPPRPLGDRARQLVPDGDRERHSAGREGGRARRRRPPGLTLAGSPVVGRCMIGALSPKPTNKRGRFGSVA